ncbi:hypothetical protein AcV7_007202 [Taiwanofungus camphoratus]|nr:hypothetical protein AcV7_007202 [Antrodia cinnamomea]
MTDKFSPILQSSRRAPSIQSPTTFYCIIPSSPTFEELHLQSAFYSLLKGCVLSPTTRGFQARNPPPSDSPKTSPVFTRSQAREAASRSASENLNNSSTTLSTTPDTFDHEEEDLVDHELEFPSTSDERTSSPELLGLSTPEVNLSSPNLYEQSDSSPEPEDPVESTSHTAIPTTTTLPSSQQTVTLYILPSSLNHPTPATINPSTPKPTMNQNAAPTPFIPPQGHSTAPIFDPTEDIEVLFTQCRIVDDAEKKSWAIRYPSIDVTDLWETLESFSDQTKTYAQWKADVLALYPGTDDIRKWSLVDMDQLIGERIGIHNATDLGSYYRDFISITKHLITQRRLSDIEQSRVFLQGFQPSLLAQLEARLHLKHPDHYPDDPYPLSDIHAAATFILHGTSNMPTVAAPQTTASTTTPSGMIKTEDISTIIESLSKTIATLIQPSSNKSNVAARLPSTQDGTEQTCHFCGDQSHGIQSCPHVEADIATGKCKCNTKGKVALRYVTASTSGFIATRQQHLACSTASTNKPASRLSCSTRKEESKPSKESSYSFENCKKPTTTALQTTEVSDTTPISRSTNNPAPDTVKSAAPTAVPVPATPAKPSTTTSTPSTIPAAIVSPLSIPSTQPATVSTPSAPPVHLFANAQDTTYTLPNLQNFATPSKPSNDKGKDPAYKTIVPIHQPKIANDIFACSMRSPLVTLTPEELLSISPDVCNRYREAVTPKDYQRRQSKGALQPGATIVPDPYKTYLKHVPHGEHPTNLMVARDSNAIRSIYALVDNKEQIECIVDPGSQIIAMSEEVCLGLKLLFDPTIQLNMQSTNGEVDRSLGLIRNVPFQIGEVVLYLQAHVIRNAAYDILLG